MIKNEASDVRVLLVFFSLGALTTAAKLLRKTCKIKRVLASGKLEDFYGILAL